MWLRPLNDFSHSTIRPFISHWIKSFREMLKTLCFKNLFIIFIMIRPIQSCSWIMYWNIEKLWTSGIIKKRDKLNKLISFFITLSVISALPPPLYIRVLNAQFSTSISVRNSNRIPGYPPVLNRMTESKFRRHLSGRVNEMVSLYLQIKLRVSTTTKRSHYNRNTYCKWFAPYRLLPSGRKRYHKNDLVGWLAPSWGNWIRQGIQCNRWRTKLIQYSDFFLLFYRINWTPGH